VSRVPWAGRVAVVTGASSGIGRALALALAAAGARLALADVEASALARTAADVEALGGTVLAVPTDVSRREEVERLADRVYDRFGVTHLLCNNAGVVVHGSLADATWQDWQWVLGVNLWGVIHGLGAFLPRMIPAGPGSHVLNTASMAGLIASKGLGVYTASKYAVVGLSETLARDLRPHGIGVTVLCPMGVATRIRQADRNRPADLRPPEAGADAPVELIGATLAPEQVAARTLAAVQRGALYVLTHPEAREPLRRRFQRLDDAFEDVDGV
jgi:NAD(P)-dependent dehydrogenase (short-subunit alcohol dehydrogenase family)